MKSTGAPSSNELQWLDSNIGRQDSSSSNGRQGDMLHYRGTVVVNSILMNFVTKYFS